MLHRYIKIFSLACLTLILAVSGILGWHFLVSQAQTQAYDMAGWYWSDNYGWISLNSGNAELASYPALPAYKVSVDINRFVTGWGWSPNVGWVCFGSTCDPNNICDLAAPSPCDPNGFGTTKPSGGWQAKIDSTTHQITGWAKIVSLTDYGWIHLGMGVPTAPGQAGAQCYDCQAHCDVWNYAGDPPAPTTCAAYSAINFDACGTCFTRTRFDNANIPDANVTSTVGGSGNVCFNGSACQKAMSADNINSRIACNATVSCYLYGGASDAQTGGSLGWAWNGNSDEASSTGAGWVQLNPKAGESGLVFPWLQTQYGAVFGNNAFRQKAVVSGINATYCIFAKDVLNFRSQNCGKNIPGVSIAFPQKNNADASYKNALGRLDIYGLSTTVDSGHKYNKYGNIVTEITGNPNWTSAQAAPLDNKVFLIHGNLSIGSGFNVVNGNAGQAGNGLVIVEGNLYIDNDFSYDAGSVVDAKQLASIAWIVKGDVIIKSTVRNAVGAFIVLGQDGVGCQYADGALCDNSIEYPRFRQNGYGVFSTADLADPADMADLSKPLSVSGLVLAKAFNLVRSYSDIRQGSEKIIYDGRLMANPPPGLKSLLELLPVIRDFQL